jgi:hypothetical protein
VPVLNLYELKGDEVYTALADNGYEKPILDLSVIAPAIFFTLNNSQLAQNLTDSAVNLASRHLGSLKQFIKRKSSDIRKA